MNLHKKIIRIGHKEVIFSTNLLVKNEQEVFLDIPVQDELLKLSLVFKTSETSDKPDGQWNFIDGVVKFTFTGWTNPLGSCILEPTKFGDLANKHKLYFQISHHYVGELNSVTLYIYLGGEDE
jgi:acyl-CoA-binding protein